MKILGAFNILFLSLFLSGCSLPPKVSSDYDRDFDFSSLKHYRWFELPGDVEADELIIQRLRRAVDRQMGIKGFTERSESPDFLISMQGFKESFTRGTGKTTSHQGSSASNTQRWATRETMRQDDFRESSYTSSEYTEGNLTLTIINAATDQPVWEGVARGLVRSNVSSEEREQRINEAIARLLADFPPAKK